MYLFFSIYLITGNTFYARSLYPEAPFLPEVVLALKRSADPECGYDAMT
jgi:hypothetical protein